MEVMEDKECSITNKQVRTNKSPTIEENKVGELGVTTFKENKEN